MQQIDPTRLSQLNQKEKELNQLLMSGLENFQPHLNMFGSNVFSSVESGARGSIDIQSVVRSIDGLVNLKTRQPQEGGIATRFVDQKPGNDELGQLLRASGQTNGGASPDAGGRGLAGAQGRDASPNKKHLTTRQQRELTLNPSGDAEADRALSNSQMYHNPFAEGPSIAVSQDSQSRSFQPANIRIGQDQSNFSIYQ